MKRRSFMTCAAMGGAALWAGGCSRPVLRERVIRPLRQEFDPKSLKVTHPKPPAGSMPMGEIGKTGIKVSKLAFGSHLPKGLIPLEKERRRMIHEAIDYGVTLVDVYADQYEAMPGHLEPYKDKVLLSIMGGRTEKRGAQEQLEYILRLFKRDHIDLVRMHSHTPQTPQWPDWEVLFKLKEKGYIRAVGVPIHYIPELDQVLESFPIDFVVFPYNFYHNIVYTGKYPGDYDPMIQKLRDKGIGVITMKPFASEYFISYLMQTAKEIDPRGETSPGQAMLRYIINSGLKPDMTLAGMWTLNDVYDAMTSYFKPAISGEENQLLDKLRKYAKLSEQACLPEKYRFLDTWAPGEGKGRMG
jgi:predicted aldo/keto reductase-like oxidoreductase